VRNRPPKLNRRHGVPSPITRKMERAALPFAETTATITNAASRRLAPTRCGNRCDSAGRDQLSIGQPRAWRFFSQPAAPGTRFQPPAHSAPPSERLLHQSRRDASSAWLIARTDGWTAPSYAAWKSHPTRAVIFAPAPTDSWQQGDSGEPLAAEQMLMSRSEGQRTMPRTVIMARSGEG
jgi:hypothetical protein